MKDLFPRFPKLIAGLLVFGLLAFMAIDYASDTRQVRKIEKAQVQFLSQEKTADDVDTALRQYLASQQKLAAKNGLYLVYFISSDLPAAIGKAQINSIERGSYMGAFTVANSYWDRKITITIPDYSIFDLEIGDNIGPGDILFIWEDPDPLRTDILDFAGYKVPNAHEGRVYTRDYEISWAVLKLDGTFLKQWMWADWDYSE